MNHSCDICLSQGPLAFTCKCNFHFCKRCFGHMTYRAFNPRCPGCNRLFFRKYTGKVQRPNGVDLTKVRAVRGNLVYIIGLHPDIANEEVSFKQTLCRQEYFGQYGRIEKCVVNRSKAYNHAKCGLSFSAYLTYGTELEAVKCIRACNQLNYKEHEMGVTFGTSKYCSSFLNSQACNRSDCSYLHEQANLQDMHMPEVIQQQFHIKPVNSIIERVKVIITPNSQYLPTVNLARPRINSEPYCRTPTKQIRSFSYDTCVIKTQSRFQFLEDSDEDPVEMPEQFVEIINQSSPSKTANKLRRESVEEILGENSPDRWLTDVIDMKQSEGSDRYVVVTAKVHC